MITQRQLPKGLQWVRGRIAADGARLVAVRAVLGGNAECLCHCPHVDNSSVSSALIEWSRGKWSVAYVLVAVFACGVVLGALIGEVLGRWRAASASPRRGLPRSLEGAPPGAKQLGNLRQMADARCR